MKTVYVLIIFFCWLMLTGIEAKIRILTFHYNLPELIEIQHKTLKKFVKDDYELIVFNDAQDPNLKKAIQETCSKLKIRHIRYRPEWHDSNLLNAQIMAWTENSNLYSHIGPLSPNHPSVRHCHVIQYALDRFAYAHDDLVVLLDGDCFPSRPVHFKKLLGKNHIVGIRKEQGGYEYLWVVLTLFDPRTAPYKKDLKFHVDVINNEIHDTGSHTYHYLKHPEVLSAKIQGGSSSGFYHWTDDEMRNFGFTSHEIALMRELDSLKDFPWPITVEFHINNQFIHLGNSAFGLPGHKQKLQCVKRFVESILNEKF